MASGTHMPMMANALDKATLIRYMSCTPDGLLNHRAAIYQMLTGYPPDRVSPSGRQSPVSYCRAQYPSRVFTCSSGRFLTAIRIA
jgi:hypothetical protein